MQVRQAYERAEFDITQGRVEDASRIVASVPRATPYAAIYGRFLDGRIAEATGRLTVARDIYRSILAAHPDLARVRVHLARTLSALDDVDAARHHYETLLGSGDIDASILDRIRTDTQAIERQKRWTASSYITVAPTTNMTSGTSLSAFDLSGATFTPAESGRKRSGVGVLYGGDAAYVAPLADNWGWLATLSTQHRDYSNKDFDDRSGAVSAGLRYLLPAGVLTGEMTAQRRWFANDAYQFAAGPKITLRSLFGTANRITVTSSFSLQRYDSLSYQDGQHVSLSASWDRFTAVGEFARIGVTFNAEKTQLAHLDYRESGFFAGYNFELPAAIVAYPEVAISWRPYHGDFPFSDSPRKDRQASASLTVLKKDISMFGFAPRVQATYLRNRSNIGLYDYNKLEGNLTLTREF
ncbi:MAG: repeat-containing protein precursor [Hyphomicrobiales bacterium]|nr:repeat-containing protein precursor [Hyphomicrobiales bacterium]